MPLFFRNQKAIRGFSADSDINRNVPRKDFPKLCIIGNEKDWRLEESLEDTFGQEVMKTQPATVVWTEVYPPNLYVKALNLNVTVFGDGAFRRLLKLDEIKSWGPNPTGLVVL